ncbi:MAG: type II toxin-antitoxin system RelB/DinJ family antitoxin [Firmicutes bacterium]|nr:type II toxin-antitoxin system RelB/DinJ family antitoxin [Bacillota bacterium]
MNVTFRVDEDIKMRADSLFNELGMSLSTAFNLFLRQSVREQRLPFAVTMHVPNETTLAAIEEAERDEKLYGPFDSVDDLMESLNA